MGKKFNPILTFAFWRGLPIFMSAAATPALMDKVLEDIEDENRARGRSGPNGMSWKEVDRLRKKQKKGK